MKRSVRSPRARLLLPIGAFLLAAAAFIPTAQPSTRLAKSRLDAAAKVYPVVSAQYGAGTQTVESVYQWSERWYQADRAVNGNGQASQEHYKRMQALDALVKSRVQSGVASNADALAVAYFRAEAELWASEPAR
jgi:hypothetical protein